MPENRIHKIIKLLMVMVLLLMAYFLPGICVRRMGGQESASERNMTAEEKDEKKNADGENMEDSQNNQQKDNGSEGALINSQGEEAGGNHETDGSKESGQRGVIVLDPGHGGEDPGMIGVGGVKEKEINLQVAKKLGGLLEQQGFQVAFTRTEDVGLYDAETSNKKAQDMQRRCALIEEKKPILTVSIHQNSYTDSSVYGPQVFYFEHSAEGKALASCVQDQLNSRLEIGKPRVIKGNTNYYILKRSEGITILVECSFLSNPQEAEKIQTSEYQQAVAQAICSGILEYLKNKEEA